ncbi:MAG: hypothetical protein HYV16_00425 [Gammaproteobacteria bacterium]|nr:hypothetical protein [Gammaproteobacteria bacterium]
MRANMPDTRLFAVFEAVPPLPEEVDVGVVPVKVIARCVTARERAKYRAWARRECKARRRPLALVWRRSGDYALVSLPAGCPRSAITQDRGLVREIWRRVQAKPESVIGVRFFTLD